VDNLIVSNYFDNWFSCRSAILSVSNNYGLLISSLGIFDFNLGNNFLVFGLNNDFLHYDDSVQDVFSYFPWSQKGYDVFFEVFSGYFAFFEVISKSLNSSFFQGFHVFQKLDSWFISFLSCFFKLESLVYRYMEEVSHEFNNFTLSNLVISLWLD